MRRVLLAVIIVAVLVIGFFVYRSQSEKHLNVEPHARKEIEKAKRR